MIYGLTGIIGCGKSTAAQMFAELGAFVVDLDKVGHWALEASDTVKSNLRKFFGDEIFDGDAVDRAKLGELVFDDPNKLRILNAIIHPIMIAKAEEMARQAEKQGHDFVIIDAALIFEVGFENSCEAVIAVESPVEACIARVMQRSKLSEAQVRTRMENQLPQDEKVELADYVLHNNGSLDDLRANVTSLYKKLTQ